MDTNGIIKFLDWGGSPSPEYWVMANPLSGYNVKTCLDQKKLPNLEDLLRDAYYVNKTWSPRSDSIPFDQIHCACCTWDGLHSSLRARGKTPILDLRSYVYDSDTWGDRIPPHSWMNLWDLSLDCHDSTEIRSWCTKMQPGRTRLHAGIRTFKQYEAALLFQAVLSGTTHSRHNECRMRE